jgi:hypothetical protein
MVTTASSWVTEAVAVWLFDPYDARIVHERLPESTDAVKVEEIPETGFIAPHDAGSTAHAESNGWPYLSTAANDCPVLSVMVTVVGLNEMTVVSWLTVISDLDETPA